MNWPGLLAWSTKYHDGTAPSEFKVMTPEDRKFLETAMEEAFGKVVDVNQIMADAIAQIKSSDRTEESITVALEVIDKCCDDVDCARNCEKLDGIQALLDLLDPPKSHNDSVCDRTLEILALLFANNPNIQEAGSRRGAIDIFLRLVKESEAGSSTRSKAFRALVALVRAQEKLEELFIKEKDGINVIISCIDESDVRLCEKVASFITSLAGKGKLLTEDVASLAKALTPLLSAMGQGGIQYRETLSSCVAQLAQLAPTACPQELRAAAEARLKELTGDDDAIERDNLKEFLSSLSTSAAGYPAAAA